MPTLTTGSVVGAVDHLAVGQVGWPMFGVWVDVVGVEPTEWGLGAQVALAALLYEERVALNLVEESDLLAVIGNE